MHKCTLSTRRFFVRATSREIVVRFAKKDAAYLYLRSWPEPCGSPSRHKIPRHGIFENRMIVRLAYGQLMRNLTQECQHYFLLLCTVPLVEKSRTAILLVVKRWALPGKHEQMRNTLEYTAGRLENRERSEDRQYFETRLFCVLSFLPNSRHLERFDKLNLATTNLENTAVNSRTCRIRRKRKMSICILWNAGVPESVITEF